MPTKWAHVVEELLEQVRHKAYELFERNGKQDGQHLDHWLQAEQLLLAGNAEVKHVQDAFELEIHVAGFLAKEIEVLTLPNALMIRAETKLMDPNEEPSTHVLFRRYQFPEEIDPVHTSANLAKGVLRIVAPIAVAVPKALAHAASA